MGKSPLNRREFLKAGLTGLASTSAAAVLLADELKNKKSQTDKAAVSTNQDKLPQPPGGRREGFIYRTLGRTGIVLPVVCMGVMNTDSYELVRAALDAGMVHLDTAHNYLRGRSEEVIGQVIKGRPRDSFVVA
ncbi:MAG TPA: aldo/keto reductase, partial [Candidatus Saccharicenans sp.]|nr:aldo/keto reductase [Candidatus Saccharicenans sp.]